MGPETAPEQKFPKRETERLVRLEANLEASQPSMNSCTEEKTLKLKDHFSTPKFNVRMSGYPLNGSTLSTPFEHRFSECL